MKDKKQKGGTGMKAWKKLERYFPPGYEYEKESLAAGLLFVLGLALNLPFLVRLYDAKAALYYMNRTTGRTLMEGKVAESFCRLIRGYPALFLPFYMFLIAMIFIHYAYYCWETKSIYLMRRLPKRDVLWKSCLQVPFTGMGAGTAGIVLLYLIYYVVYLLLMPAESLPRLM